MRASEAIDYGLDAPTIMRRCIFFAAILGALVFISLSLPQGGALRILQILAAAGSLYAVSYLGAMNLYSRWLKFRHRDRMLNATPWRGDEQVLDVGTGRGLLAIGAAKRAPRGKAYGVDVWLSGDLSQNSMANALRNAELEGVARNVEFLRQDARRLSFADESFDKVLSLLCLHNICDHTGKFDEAGRLQACREIARVLKPGGSAIISDGWHVPEYATAFGTLGLRVTHSSPHYFSTFPPLRTVVATKEQTVKRKPA